ncbi:EF-hand domain-containing family member B [Octodon degus]|uniref:EF-hand domain-containing family member B n=1 Tax=Octodon degus TaxID=10160 RepID=A0A6P3FYL5_OCTDE|nr:EF-hand domain-containing family member B [Octodon degus]
MCSFLRVRSPMGMKTSLEPSTALPLTMNTFGRTKVSEGKFPLSMELGKVDSEDQRIFMGTKSPAQLGFEKGFRQEDSQWRESPVVSNKYKESIALPGTQSPCGKELERGLEKQNVCRTFGERGNVGFNRVSPLQETKPLGELSGSRVGLENGCCLAQGPYVRGAQPPLGAVCGCPQVVGNRKGAMAYGLDGLEPLVGKQPPLGLEGRQELEKESTCVVVKPGTEMTPPVEVDIGLPRVEGSHEAEIVEPQMGLVIEPSECQFAQQPEEAGTVLPGVESPDCIRPIYSGRFIDRMPCWPTAGKVTPIGHRVATCLTEKLPRLITPPEAKKYYNFRYPPPGAERVFYGKANDPKIAPYLTHGIRSKISIPADTLINPQPITTFQQKLKEKKESIYYSNRWAPLGKSHDQTPGLPKGLDVINTTFGTAVIREFSAREVVNPPKSYDEVFKEGQEGHDLYVVSHNDYYVGEAKNRKYNPSSFHRFDLFGVPTPHFNDGKAVAKSLHWLHELQMKKGAKIVSKRVDDFKEKFQHKLGRVLDPIAETMTVPPGHTFGACLSPEEYGVDDLIYNRLPGTYLRGKDRQRALIAAVRHHLKKFNYQNFDTLLAAFRHYDKASGRAEFVVCMWADKSQQVGVDQESANYGYPIHGVPTIRSDIPAPRIRRVSDRTNYGEEGNAYSLLHPTIFAQKGVFERDFFKTRSKEEIAEILCNIGVKLSEEEFENVWNLASKKHHRGEVCVENIRNVLDELQHAERTKCKKSM